MRGGADRSDDVAHEAHVLEAAGAPVIPDDFLDRTPEIDVDEIGFEELGDHARGLGHDVPVRSIDLDADRSLDRLKAHIREDALDSE
jgi:hypothetical protein